MTWRTNSGDAAQPSSAPRLADFHRSRKEREQDGWFSPRAFYEESFDYSLFRRILIDPFRTAGSTGFVLAGFDEQRDQIIHQPKWITAGADALLVIDGLFLNRPDLAGLWNLLHLADGVGRGRDRQTCGQWRSSRK